MQELAQEHKPVVVARQRQDRPVFPMVKYRGRWVVDLCSDTESDAESDTDDATDYATDYATDDVTEGAAKRDEPTMPGDCARRRARK